MKKKSAYKGVGIFYHIAPLIGYSTSTIMSMKLAVVWYMSGANFLVSNIKELVINISLIILILTVSFFFDSFRVEKEASEELRQSFRR